MGGAVRGLSSRVRRSSGASSTQARGVGTPTSVEGLLTEGLSVGYGSGIVLRDLSIRVDPGESVAILGANGAGKSTLLRTISGLLRPRAGKIHFDGKDLSRLAPAKIVALGVLHVPEGRQLFASLTVSQNLALGAVTRHRSAAVDADLAAILDLFPALRPKLHDPASQLSGGQQQMLAVGRALMARPRLLMLDEPSVGLAPALVEELSVLLRRARDQLGFGLLLVEQNPSLAEDLCDRAYLLQLGQLVATSSLRDLDTSSLIGAYLGIAPSIPDHPAPTEGESR
jgi:branched-chain amino acid transport system ATP-binding protein